MAKPSGIKRILLTLAKTAGVFFILAVITFFSFRNMALNKVLAKVSEKMNRDYQVSFRVQEAAFHGLSGIRLKNISLVPQAHDSILYIHEVNTSIRLAYALFLDFRLNELEVNNGFVHLVKDERGPNIAAFLRSRPAEGNARTPAGRRNLATHAYRLITRALNLIPGDVRINNVWLELNDGEDEVSFSMNKLLLLDGKLESSIRVMSRDVNQQWELKGSASPRSKKADVLFYNTDTGKVLIPYIHRKFHLVAGFDSIRLRLDEISLDDDVLTIKGLAGTRNFLVNHPKVSSKDVVIEDAGLEYTLLVGTNSIALDSSSTVTFNRVRFHPFVKYERSPEDTVYQLNIITGNTLAQDFILSLPEGLFTHFKGMEAEGSFTYRLDFLYSPNRPSDLVFESRLDKEGLRILKYGEANLGKLNTDFVYVPVERGKPQRPIELSYTNPNFAPLDHISPMLKKTVLTTEDPSFFYHRGFIDEAFRQSIIKNIRKRGFVRGASTISMQLVKNVFLTREKTLSRKLEEILLVYILENNRLCSKERMFEVYLNIIEWGPNVYGISEAARFYFNKRPDELTLSESMFLSIIIPSPKKFMWRFGKDGQLKDHVGRHFQSLAGLMIRRNVLMQEDTLGLTHHITISGPARNFIRVTADTLANDSILLDENGLLINEDE